MDDLELLIDLHLEADRQGPGGNDETRFSVLLSGLKDAKNLNIADIGCGTGASTLILAQELDANVTAVDFLSPFLERLNTRVVKEGLAERISTLEASMETLPFEEQSLDAIWSEGAIYNIGFENGVKSWRRFLKPDGILAVSELTWLTNERPRELDQYWMQEYSEVALASDKLAILEKNGYSPIGYFPLPKHCWLENYYYPMQARFTEFLSRHDNSEPAQAIVAAEKQESNLYERFSEYFSYGYYVAKKVSD